MEQKYLLTGYLLSKGFRKVLALDDIDVLRHDKKLSITVQTERWSMKDENKEEYWLEIGTYEEIEKLYSYLKDYSII